VATDDWRKSAIWSNQRFQFILDEARWEAGRRARQKTFLRFLSVSWPAMGRALSTGQLNFTLCGTDSLILSPWFPNSILSIAKSYLLSSQVPFPRSPNFIPWILRFYFLGCESPSVLLPQMAGEFIIFSVRISDQWLLAWKSKHAEREMAGGMTARPFQSISSTIARWNPPMVWRAYSACGQGQEISLRMGTMNTRHRCSGLPSQLRDRCKIHQEINKFLADFSWSGCVACLRRKPRIPGIDGRLRWESFARVGMNAVELAVMITNLHHSDF